MNNSIFMIQPYFNGMWVFNDERVSLNKEPFVGGADDFIEYALRENDILEKGKQGFKLLFSTLPFKGYQYEVEKIGYEFSGTLYKVVNYKFKNKLGENSFWLCPALNLYFPISPTKIYVRFQL